MGERIQIVNRLIAQPAEDKQARAKHALELNENELGRFSVIATRKGLELDQGFTG